LQFDLLTAKSIWPATTVIHCFGSTHIQRIVSLAHAMAFTTARAK
jgi:hypothetical protein